MLSFVLEVEIFAIPYLKLLVCHIVSSIHACGILSSFFVVRSLFMLLPRGQHLNMHDCSTKHRALKFCFKTCIAMKFVDDDDDDDDCGP